MSVYKRLYANPAGQIIQTDSDNFGPPQLGGQVNVKFGRIVYSQSLAYLFTLPKGAEIVGWLTNVSTAFNDSGTDLLDIGDGTIANRFADNLDISSVGQIVTGYDDDEMFVELTAETKFFASYTGQNANASAGAAVIACQYILR